MAIILMNVVPRHLLGWHAQVAEHGTLLALYALHSHLHGDVLKIIALGFKSYIRVAWCRFDASSCVVGDADRADLTNAAIVAVLRVLRVVRNFRLVARCACEPDLSRSFLFFLF
jgi:hypothetical protein